MIDPTIAALVGAGIGMAGTIISPILTSKRTHRARRRDLMLEAYAEGMRSITDIVKEDVKGGYVDHKKRLVEAQLQIRLAGSQAAYRAFDELRRHAYAYMAEETNDPSHGKDRPESPVFRAQMEFILVARIDLGTYDPFFRRFSENLIIELKDIRAKFK